jgi:multidrug efflux pump subunit AcrA (membrane-fusion protein)
MNIETRVPALNERVLPGRIKSLSPYIVPETKTFEVVVTFYGEKENLRPGMFTYLNFVLEERNDIFRLPKEVLISSDTLWYVDESSMTAKKISLTPAFSNGDYFEIGPEWENYPFIAEGQHFLREGQAVRIINEDS